MSATDKLAYRVNEFCALVGISRATLYKLMSEGKINTIRIGGRRLISAAEAARLIGEAAKSEVA